MELVKPYSRINCQFLATQLTIELEEVEDLLVRLILDNEIEAKIDQVKHVLQVIELMYVVFLKYGRHTASVSC